MQRPHAKPNSTGRILEIVRRYWGFDALRPLQAEAIEAALAGRDSVVVMPTGGGKSLCYQVPPALDGATDIVISPLIALMKDQVDGLRTCGYPAACLHSNQSADEQRAVEAGLAEGKFRLLLIAPERAVTGWFVQLAARLNIRRFSIDEAHCISHWGHDFRPDYRQLALLRERIPQASLHAFTATATPRVRDDIAAQLKLRDPAMLVGQFDRPNLVYRILPQVDVGAQVLDVIARHPSEAVIVYCLSRKDTESMAGLLQRHGIRAAHYHAGMAADDRRRAQDSFAEERIDVVVATVAFGMGIDRSNVRCVLHAGIPKSVEHYQQETGRAGRDGLEAECVLLYSVGDVMRLESLLQKSAAESPDPEVFLAAQMRLLKQMQRLCNSHECRHKMLSEYFGQTYEKPNCGGCDVCLSEVETLDDATVVAQKILSCVARTGERFGVGHVVEVLIGSNTEQVRKFQHDKLSTYGLLKDHAKKELQALVYQLVDQGLLTRSEGEYPTLSLNDLSWAVMRGQREVKLSRPKQKVTSKTAAAEISWEGVDRGLFDHLRDWRRQIALERSLPAFVVFDDRTLANLARMRPTTLAALARVPGIGEKRLADFGADLNRIIPEYCTANGLATNQGASGNQMPAPRATAAAAQKQNLTQSNAMPMFDQQRTIEEVMSYTGRARSTVVQYLADYIAQRRPERIDVWVDPATYERVASAVAGVESPRLKPIHEQLGGAVSYDEIRLVLAHLSARNG